MGEEGTVSLSQPFRESKRAKMFCRFWKHSHNGRIVRVNVGTHLMSLVVHIQRPTSHGRTTAKTAYFCCVTSAYNGECEKNCVADISQSRGPLASGCCFTQRPHVPEI